MMNQNGMPETTPVSFELEGNFHESKFPVIKIDFEGTILYANNAAFELIREWGGAASRKLPVNILNMHPELLDRHSDSETELSSSNRTVKFNVVAFREAGYTGLYGYDMEFFNPEQKLAG